MWPPLSFLDAFALLGALGAVPPAAAAGDQALPPMSRIRGDGLRAALAGKLVQSTRCYSSDQCSEVFGRDGHSYHRSGDRIPWTRGSYSLLHDRVCTTLPRRGPLCRFLLRSDEGAFFLSRADELSLGAVEVRISDASGIPLPD
jgi:hypothetical protein